MREIHAFCPQRRNYTSAFVYSSSTEILRLQFMSLQTFLQPQDYHVLEKTNPFIEEELEDGKSCIKSMDTSFKQRDSLEKHSVHFVMTGFGD
jgi:hypothetical protein